MKEKIIVIGGATGAGKSSTAVELARRFDGEIIGADSMQIYRGLDVGTAKITASEMRNIPHHMIDIIEPYQEFSVGEYVDRAKQIIDDICARNKLPIIVGGTGLYIKSLLSGHTFCGISRNQSVRSKLMREAEECGTAFLYDRLSVIDPVSAQKISRNDLKRIVRALEIFTLTGKTKSKLVDESVGHAECQYDYLFFVLMTHDLANREILYQRLNKRVDNMLSAGLIDEVSKLNMQPNWQACSAIGYKEVLEYLAGSISYDDMTEKLKMNTRRYAKRQSTYFRNIELKTISVDALDADALDFMIQRTEDFLLP